MDFFAQQDQAHRQTRKLIILFVLAVIGIVIAVNAGMTLAWILAANDKQAGLQHLPFGFYFTNTAVTLLFIGGGMLFEMWRLSDGGDAVARMAGGTRVDPQSRDKLERRLLNVVEEMALASGIACPNVYILEREDSINAFAAGYHQNQAVVAVTRGTLHRLSRDELQGVIAHEFSHILNGDMRMNIRLIGILFGIQMIAGFGQELLYWGWRMGGSRDKDEKGVSLQVLMIASGIMLYLVGYIGLFFGRLIKSAVSRQREFLADASAVQFTRNPEGIGSALRKLAGLSEGKACGSQIDNSNAEQFSHLFLGAARPNLLSGLFATHPPLEERIKRIYGRDMGVLDAHEIVDEAALAAMPEGTMGFGARNYQARQNKPSEYGHAAAISKADALPSQDLYSGLQSRSNEVPEVLINAMRDSQSARILCCCLLTDNQQAHFYQQQLQLIQQLPGATKLLDKIMPAVRSLSVGARLPLLDLAMPALKLLSKEEQLQLLQTVEALVAVDGQISRSEFVLQSVLERRLGPDARRMPKIRYHKLSELNAEVGLILGVLLQSLPTARQVRALAQLANSGSGLAINAQAAQADYRQIRLALQHLNELAPLAKPGLIKAMLQLCVLDGQVEVATIDVFRAICAAIDAPVPEQIQAVTPTSLN